LVICNIPIKQGEKLVNKIGAGVGLVVLATFDLVQTFALKCINNLFNPACVDTPHGL
jgi:hypothetical protein